MISKLSELWCNQCSNLISVEANNVEWWINTGMGAGDGWGTRKHLWQPIVTYNIDEDGSWPMNKKYKYEPKFVQTFGETLITSTHNNNKTTSRTHITNVQNIAHNKNKQPI